MKIVHLITGLTVGGAENMLAKLVSQMESGPFHSVVVSLMDEGPMGRRIRELGVPVYALGMRRRTPALGSLVGLARLLARERPAVLQTWMYHADLLGLFGGRMSRVPHIVWNVRRSDCLLTGSPLTTKWTVKACSRLSSRPSAVVINSETGRARHAEQGYRPRRWAVIPNGFELDRFTPDEQARESVRAELGIEAGAILIGIAGRYHRAKDYPTFLAAAKQIVRTRPGVRFLLAGREIVAENQELARVIDGHAVGRSMHFLGERADMPRLMAALDIFTSSSGFAEGFPNVIGEAMSCGVPCVATDIGDSASILGGTGVLVPPSDASALAGAWEQLIQAGPSRRRALGEAARDHIRCHYSAGGIARKYEALYLSLVRN